MIEIVKNGDVWEVQHGGAIEHTGTLESCGSYIFRHAEEMEEWENR